MFNAEPDTSGVESEKGREDGLAQVSPGEECNELSELPDESFEVVHEIEPDARVSQSPPVKHLPDNPTVADDTGDMGPRRPERQRSPTDFKAEAKLQYALLGNLLISVIQSLFQGLSSALSESVEESDYIKYHQNTGCNAVSPV